MKKCLSIFYFILISTNILAQIPDTSVFIRGKGSRGPYLIGFRNLIKNSMKLYRDKVELSPDSFSVVYEEGLINLSRPLNINDSILVSFKYLPLNLEPNYYLHRPTEPGEGQSENYQPAIEPIANTGSDLSIVGSKGFSIETGGGGGLSQSLNLTIKGNLIPGLRTSAHISDKSQGNTSVTRKLDELDRIYIEAESDHFRGVFGDFDYSHSGSNFMNFQRKLSGLNMKYSKSNNNLGGAAAFFPGDYSSITITGQDGRLGPYYLTDIGGRQGALVLPGSEKVFLDGILQKRGSENDYEIDYGSGSIQFAPSRVLRNESRIVVDYEIAREEYNRSFYTISGGSSLLGGLRISTDLVQEGDNKNSPKSFEMTSDNLQALQNAGAERLNASRSGVQLVGVGHGDYTASTDTLGNIYYIYAGPKRGDHIVSFSFISKNGGSYKFLGTGIYQYVGKGIGDHEPVILIPLPQTKRYASVGSSWTSPDSNIVLESEFSGSTYDRNTLSDKDALNKDISAFLAAKYQKKLFTDEGSLVVSARARNIGKSSIFPGRIDDVERYRIYDIDPNSSVNGEKVQELGIVNSFNRANKIQLQIGHLSRPLISDRLHQMGEANWNSFGFLDFYGRLEKTSGSRDWWKRSGAMTANFALLQPSLRIDYEKQNGTSGVKFNEMTGAIPATYFHTITGRTEIVYRIEQALDVLSNVWQVRFKSGSFSQQISFLPGKSGFSGDLSGVYYKKRYADFSGSDIEQKTGWGRISFSDPRNRASFSLNERLSSSNERLQAENFVFVGQGNGEYRLEDGEYIKDQQGDYILIIEELGEGIKISDISTALNASIAPFLIAGAGQSSRNSIGKLNIETDLSYRQKKSSDILNWRDFYPWKISNLQNIVYRNGQINVRIYYYPPFERQRFKYAGSRSFEAGSPFANETTDGNSRSDEISWSFPAGARIDFIFSGSISSRQNSTNLSAYSINSNAISLSADYRFIQNLTINLKPSYESAKQLTTSVRSSIPALGLGLVWNLKSRGQASANFEYSKIASSPRGSYIPYQLAQGKNEGDNYLANISARMEITKNGRLDLSYRFEDFPKRPLRQIMKLEFTALFR